MIDQRVIYNTIDISNKVNDFRSAEQAFAYVAGSYLYIGSVYPFNNLWFETGTANTNTSAISIDVWFGTSWQPMVDINDETDGLKQTGRVSWSTDRLKGWDFEQTTEEVSGLTSFRIYNKYWARFSWSANFSGGTTLKYVGQKFTTDEVLYSYYPDLNNADIKDSFKSGKTNWDEQHYMAAELIVSDLRRRGIVVSRSQLMDWTLFESAACHRVAMIAYTAFGRPYFEQLLESKKQYKDSMDMQYFSVDESGNGSLEPCERKSSSRFLTR